MSEPTILFESEDYVAIDKPAGLVVHPDGKTEEASVVDWIRARYNEALDTVGEPFRTPAGLELPRPGIVHRIDRETSGVLIIVKNERAFQWLKSQFQSHGVEKIYHACVYGEMKMDKGIINRSIGRSASDFRLRSAQRGARGELREAVTYFNVLGKGLGASYVKVQPKTGRTHQIRVHFKAINHPVICDSLYAPKREPLLGFSRLALHAKEIGFHTEGGEWIKVEAPLPPEFLKAKELLGFS